MKIIIDQQRQLNYHPLVVYFLLSSGQFETHSEKIKSLNRYKAFTRGIFKFRAIERGKEYGYCLDNNLTSEISKFNVILRLVDDSLGNYNYVLAKINLAALPDQFESSVQNFIVNACKNNIKNLKSQLALIPTDTSEGKENAELISAMVEVFTKNLTVKSVRRRDWSSDFCSLDEVSLPCEKPILSRGLPTDISHGSFSDDIMRIKKSLYSVLPSQADKDDFKKLLQYFESKMDVPDMKDSDKYVQGTVDNVKSQELTTDYYSRIKQKGYRPDITITIKKVPNSRLQQNIRMVWGVEIMVDEEIHPVNFGSVDALMVYVCTLLKQKGGNYLFRDAFKRPIPPRNSPLQRSEDLIWLEKVYRTLYPLPTQDFDDWYAKKKENSCHALNQGKSASVRKIKNILNERSDAIYYCCIQTGAHINGSTYYYLDIPSASINIPDELVALV